MNTKKEVDQGARRMPRIALPIPSRENDIQQIKKTIYYRGGY